VVLAYTRKQLNYVDPWGAAVSADRSWIAFLFRLLPSGLSPCLLVLDFSRTPQVPRWWWQVAKHLTTTHCSICWNKTSLYLEWSSYITLLRGVSSVPVDMAILDHYLWTIPALKMWNFGLGKISWTAADKFRELFSYMLLCWWNCV
jgi:hypothetical protein